MPQLPKFSEPTWNKEVAYAVGLITTDGSLSSDLRHIIFTSTDLELIKTFLTCLNKNNKIIANPRGQLNKKPAYRVQFGDVTFYRWLQSIGLGPNKSLTIGPLVIPDVFFPDFLRGHLDGDGSIINYIDRYNTKLKPEYVYERLFVYFMSASQKHIDWLRDQIYKLKGIRGSLSKRVSKFQKGDHACWLLKFSTKQAKIILSWVYYQKGLPCLERKYKIAQRFLTTQLTPNNS